MRDKVNATSLVALGTAAVQQAVEPNGTYPSYIGSRFVLITLASTIANQWAGGYLFVTQGTGLPYNYRIKGNTAAATLLAANQVLIELAEPLQATLAASTTTYLTIMGSLYNAVELNAAAGTFAGSNSVAIGVTQATISANYYGWVCTHGVTSCLTDGTITDGAMLSASKKIVGAVQEFGVGTSSNTALAGYQYMFANQPVGFCINTGGDGYQSAIFLQIE